MNMQVITGNRQFDFQINRFTMEFPDSPLVKEDLIDMQKNITDFESWYQWWSKSAEEKEINHHYDIASRYYKAAMFYLTNADSRKQELYEGFIRCFYESFHTFKYERYKIPYENDYLPALYLLNDNAKKTLLVLGGFDGYLEEVASFFKYLEGTDYNILIFDGPGQGNTSSRGLKFIPNFEKPVSIVLDYFHLSRVDAIGLSWGGYLVMRAAAFEKRINKVITMDIFYTPMDTLKMNIGRIKYFFLNLLLVLRAKKLINSAVSKMAEHSIDLKWKLNNGYQLTGETNPYDLIKNLCRHNTGKITPFINQDCLLLAGEEDQYVPVKRLRQIKKELTSAGHVTTRLFTKGSGGEQHCQVGRMDLAFEEIRRFLMM
ncbi:alpha/beta fold hydrolase [Bacillaceae bacterium Marseille-Q3522]|nr:alpha/beta fold hydrolase [Bacillaceae bacterium Marseille-Q3522]